MLVLLVLAKYPQADGRAIARRKWSAFKLGGPLLLFAELVLKRLIQHGFDASYEALSNAVDHNDPSVVVFVNALGSTPLFLQCLSDAVRIVARACRVVVDLSGCHLRLARSYRLAFRYGKRSIKPVAASFVLIEQGDDDPPF